MKLWQVVIELEVQTREGRNMDEWYDQEDQAEHDGEGSDPEPGGGLMAALEMFAPDLAEARRRRQAEKQEAEARGESPKRDRRWSRGEIGYRGGRLD